MTLPTIATFAPIVCWAAYVLGVVLVERRYASLSVIMSVQRRRWVANAARRESPLDAILSANLMGSVSFLASTSVLVILAVFTALGQLAGMRSALADAGFSMGYSAGDMQLHLVVTLTLFVLAFFSFTLSLRQFNHFCIMLGAMDRRTGVGEAEIDAIAALNTMGARNFNNGLRAYYFSVPMVAWFASEWLAIAVSVLTMLLLAQREFFSTAHRVAAQATVSAARSAEAGRSPPAASDNY